MKSNQVMTCIDCDTALEITLEQYGKGKLAVHHCQCGESYDTNIQEESNE